MAQMWLVIMRKILGILKRRRKALILCVVSALCASFAFAPRNIFILGFLFLVPVFALAEELKRQGQTRIRHAVFYGFLIGLLVDIFSYYWMFHTMMVFGHLPAAGAGALFIGYAFITNTRFILFLALLIKKDKLRKRLIALPFRLPSFLLSSTSMVLFFWAVSEWLGWQLFPWYAGNLISANIVMLQAVDMIGIAGLSLLVVWINYGLYILYKARSAKKAKSKRIRNNAILTVGALLTITHLYGFLALGYWQQKEAAAEKFSAIVPQGNTPLAFSNLRSYGEYRETMDNIIRSMVEQTRQIYYDSLMKGISPDIIVWPESAVPFQSYKSSLFFRSMIQSMLSELKIPIILNDIDRERGKSYSNMLLLGADGKEITHYHKIYLLPFGETLPLGDRFPVLYKWFPEVSDFNAGSQYTLFPTSRAKLLPIICYEVIQPDFLYSFEKTTGFESDILVNITNDRWFGQTIETYQHLDLARVRAVEFRKPLIRSTNSGVSALILPSGRVVGKTPLFQKANRLYQAPVLPKHRTLYSYLGNLPVMAFIGLYFLLFAISFWHQKPWHRFFSRSRKTKSS